MKGKARILILCTGNSARSQMAEAIVRHIGGDRVEVESAGVAPSAVREEAIAVMGEIGIDIASHRSKSVDEFVDRHFDYIITVCDNARESCPVFPGDAKRIHWSFDDPAGAPGSYDERIYAFRTSRDEMRQKLREFLDGELAAE